ncbi:MAG: hypothetical protein GY838_02435 [bacterium]|nr:hypothetical protein [bacterium]
MSMRQMTRIVVLAALALCVGANPGTADVRSPFAEADAPPDDAPTVTLVTNGWVDVRGILESLADHGGLGLELAPDVGGQVNLHLKDVSVAAAVAAVLDPIGLGWEIVDGVLVVYRNGMVTRWFQFDYPVTQRVGRGELTVSGRTSGESGSGGGGQSSNTNESNLITSSTMNVWPQVVAAVKTLVFRDPATAADVGAGDAVSLADREGRILVINPMAGLVQVTAEWPRVRDVEDLLERLETSLRRQVAISVKIFEVTTSEADRTGVDWNLITRGAVGTSLEAASNPGRPIFNFTVTGEEGDVVFEALSEQGTVRVLSTPRITTLNNQKAIVRAVTEEVFFSAQVEPRVVLAGGSASDPVVEYLPEIIPVGLVLDVTPQVGRDGIITLNVHPTLSHILRVETSPNADTQPVIAVRELDTVGKVADGETLVIAGLLSEGLIDNDAGVPVLKDIPLLGSLFKRTETEKTQTELVIMLTPHIMDRAVQEGMAREAERIISTSYEKEPGLLRSDHD